MIHKLIFQAGYFLKRSSVIPHHNNFQKTQWQSHKWLRNQQEKQLGKLVKFAYENVPYYTKLFNQLGIVPNDIGTIRDLEKLPILTKQIIKENWEDFVPKNIKKLRYLNVSTGGSTGTPLKYRMSAEDYERGLGLLYVGWGYGGYELGDKVAIIAGSSLIPTTKSKVRKKIQEFFLNFRFYYFFELSEEKVSKYFYDINKWKPIFLRGYPSSIYLLAKFIHEDNLKLNFQPKAIFTTGENLFDEQRALVETVFGAKVFNAYGAGDGGISAFECEEHCGMHINTEKAVLEVVDDEGKQVVNKQGKVLATSLYNYSMPFIRYDTGDLGVLSDKICPCGRSFPLMKELVGRSSDILITSDNKIITTTMAAYLFYPDCVYSEDSIKQYQKIKQFQVIQEIKKEVIIKIVKGPESDEKEFNYIITNFQEWFGQDIDIKLIFVESIPPLPSGKSAYIISRMNQVL